MVSTFGSFLYIILIFVGVTLYFLTRKRGPSRSSPFVTQFKQAFDSVRMMRPAANRAGEQDKSTLTPAIELDDLEAMLDDIYREFTREIAMLREEMARQVEAVKEDLRTEFEVKWASFLKNSQQHDNHQESIQHAEGVKISSEGHIRTAPVRESLRRDAGSNRFNPQYFNILDDYQKGLTPTETAKHLGLGIEEVELVLHVIGVMPNKG